MLANKYPIERNYIPKNPNTRPMLRLVSKIPIFIVAHDTGNPGAGADAHFRYFRDLKGRKASAHTFIDDKKILEIIPTGLAGDPGEKAWHVIYNVTSDNDRFGDDANDIAIGVELCYGRQINFAAAYARYVWYLALLCDRFNIKPETHIVTHQQLDPARKRDCNQALATAGLTVKNLIEDVRKALDEKAAAPIPEQPAFTVLSAYAAKTLVEDYIRPAWAAEHNSKQPDREVAAQHYANLADNVRNAAGIDIYGKPVKALRLHRSNANEIIFRWLSPAWFKAKNAGDLAKAETYHKLANQLRMASGLPVA